RPTVPAPRRWRGVVRVCVGSASHLPSGDPSLTDMMRRISRTRQGRRGSCEESTAADPYCTMQVGSQTFRTATVPKTTNPRWSPGTATGDFFVYSPRQLMHLDVYDDDFGFTHDDFLGSATLEVGDLLSTRQHTLVLDQQRGPSINRLRSHRTLSLSAHSGATDAHDPGEQAHANGHDG
ncbi:unnamed protein product, partial [Prorocentrum cordatum]